jgi:hypothetical protein
MDLDFSPVVNELRAISYLVLANIIAQIVGVSILYYCLVK